VWSQIIFQWFEILKPLIFFYFTIFWCYVFFLHMMFWFVVLCFEFGLCYKWIIFWFGGYTFFRRIIMLLDLYVWATMVVSNVFLFSIFWCQNFCNFATEVKKFKSKIHLTNQKFPKFQVEKSEFSLKQIKTTLVVSVNMVAHNKGSNGSN
jgi:hypothetical protein